MAAENASRVAHTAQQWLTCRGAAGAVPPHAHTPVACSTLVSSAAYQGVMERGNGKGLWDLNLLWDERFAAGFDSASRSTSDPAAASASPCGPSVGASAAEALLH